MDTFTIYTLGGGDILFGVFNALASLLNPTSSTGILKTFVTMGTYVGATMAIWLLVFKNQLQQVGKWFISYTILVLAVTSPISRVLIKDSMTNKKYTVEHVPFILAFGSSIVSSLGNGLTQVVEQAFQSSPNEQVGGVGITGNPPSNYSKTGFIFGAEVLNNMKRVAFTNTDIEQNMFGFVNQCITYDALLGKKYTIHDLKHSSNLWKLVSEKASKLRGFPWRHVQRGTDNSFLSSSRTEIITCAQGVEKFNHLWDKIGQSSLDDLAQKIQINQTWSKPSNELTKHVKSYLPGALEKLTSQSKESVEHVKQQLMISSILKGSEQKTIELGGSPDFEVRKAYFQQSDNYKNIGHLVAQGLPSIKNVLEAILYCMFLFVIALIFLPDGTKILWFYFKVLFWLQLWAPLFAILNFIMTEAMSWQSISALKGADGVTIGNFVGLTNMTNDMANIAGYLCSMIPILSWMILERGGYAFVNMASSLLGVAQGAALQSSNEKVSGNYSYGNTNLGNSQMFTAHQLKQDLAPSYSGSGHMITNDGASSVLTAASGEKILTMQESHIPISLNVAQTQENTLRESQREALSFAEGEQKSSQISQSQAQNHYLEIGKQAQHMMTSGTQISDQQQAQVLKEAADHYSRVEDVANRTGLSKEYLNQKIIEASLGGTASRSSGSKFSLVSLAAELGGKMSKAESSNMTATQAAEEVFTLSRNTNFNEAHQRMDNAFRSKTFDINDQELKQSTNNFSSAYETSKRHEENAHKSYEKAKSLDHEIAYTQNNASTINASHTQAFVEHVGVEDLKHMNLQEQQRKAYNYMQNQRHLETHFPNVKQMDQNSTASSIKNDYNNSKQDQSLTDQQSIKQQHQDFSKNDYKKEALEGVKHHESRALEKNVDRMFDNQDKKIMQAEAEAKTQHVKAHQIFKDDHKKHAEDDQGFTQEGVTKDMLKDHEQKKRRT